MSQEEIESLMNGLDFGNDDAEEESTEDNKENQSNEKMSEDDINDLIAQTEDIISEEKEDDLDKKVSEDDIEALLSQAQENDNTDIETNNTQDNDESLNELLNTLDDEKSDNSQNEEQAEDDIEDILNELEKNDTTKNEEESKEDSSVSDESLDELLASIDGIEDDTKEQDKVVKEETSVEDEVKKEVKEELPKEIKSENEYDEKDDGIDDKISRGLFPLPVDDDTKVVNQLSIVANDSEEKATKIFDVLSNILDYNTEIQNDVQALASFNEKQLNMLTSLSNKFPNINAFKLNLEQSQLMDAHIQDINDKLNSGNTEIFQAMELMQYHDINRQKIERVMSVIRKLSTYLNNLFEDSGSHDEVAIAKHIHGDKGSSDLMADDDLEALIAEFNK
ncbi:MAG: hypothetical protein ACNI25_01470 [Halarcobacter sp.]